MTSEDDVDPRVRIVNEQSGEVRYAAAKDLEGLDRFIAGWKHDVKEPHHLEFSGWQMSDDEHPAGEGRLGYRSVRKTVRTITTPNLSFTLPNLRINFSNSTVTLGEPRFPAALKGRRVGEHLFPEWGRIESRLGNPAYLVDAPEPVQMAAHQESTPHGNFVEILYILDADVGSNYHEMLAAGRAAMAPLTVTLDLMFGNRVMGPVVTEEVGELFADWHWNRLLGGRTVSLESQANLVALDARAVAMRIGTALRTNELRDSKARARLRVASQWYWVAEADPDNVQRYIGYWLTLEALELGQNANIRPIYEAVASLLGADPTVVKQTIGRMYGIRSKLVHGERRAVSDPEVAAVRAVAIALLERRALNFVSEERLSGLEVAIGVRRPGLAFRRRSRPYIQSREGGAP